MTPRVYRQLPADAPIEAPRTAAADSVLRLALALWAADVRAGITPAQRQWVIERCAPPAEDAAWRVFTAQEKARIRAPLLAYLTEQRPSIVAIVERQLREETA